tara:strand:- start:172 stop:402 length:231 start_codon:yes stop_codon:yes gene_type:complete
MPQDDLKTIKDNGYSIYKSVRDRIETENLDAVEFATSLINVAKILLHEEMPSDQAEMFFDMVNKSFLIEKNNVTYH